LAAVVKRPEAKMLARSVPGSPPNAQNRNCFQTSGFRPWSGDRDAAGGGEKAQGERHVLMGLMFLAAVIIAMVSCVSSANAIGAHALAEWSKGDYAAAARTEKQAASSLEDCLAYHQEEIDESSQQRVGELWMYTGGYESDDAEWDLARLSLMRAKAVFRDLRATGKLRGTTLDEVLLDAHQADTYLAKVARKQSI
jgi:hypothetical protein